MLFFYFQLLLMAAWLSISFYGVLLYWCQR